MKGELRAFLATAFSQPAFFDEGVEAARNACVAGASLASAVMTAVAWYENPLTGSPALLDALERLRGLNGYSSFESVFARAPHPITADPGYSPGFGYANHHQAEAVRSACQMLMERHPRGYPSLAFWFECDRRLTRACGPLNATGLCALAFHDLRLATSDAERLFLILRVEAALAEAQRARALGLNGFPFFSDIYRYEGPLPAARSFDLDSLLMQVGIPAR